MTSVVTSLAAIGCTTSLDWDVESDACGGDGVATVRVAGITQGGCGVPGPPVDAEMRDDGTYALPPGEYCFWTLEMEADPPGGDAVCRLRRVAASSRTLPGGDEDLALKLSCPADPTAYDEVVARIAGCAPRCDPGRCACARHPSCLSDPSARCPEPVSGDLVALSEHHACAASLYGEEVWCWGDAAGWGEEGEARPTQVLRAGEDVLPADFRVTELAVGANMTCARDGRDHVYCTGPEGAGPRDVEYDFDGEGPEEARRIRALALAVGGSFGVALVARPGAEGRMILWWRWAAGDETVPPGFQVRELNIERSARVAFPNAVAATGDRVCVLDAGIVKCALPTADEALLTEDTRWQLGTADGGVPRSYSELAAGGGRFCATDDLGRVVCDGQGDRGDAVGRISSESIPPLRGLAVGAAMACAVSRQDGKAYCVWRGDRDVASQVLGSLSVGGHGVVCGTDRSTVVCRSLPIQNPDAGVVVDPGVRDALLARDYTREGGLEVCP